MSLEQKTNYMFSDTDGLVTGWLQEVTLTFPQFMDTTKTQNAIKKSEDLPGGGTSPSYNPKCPAEPPC